MSKKVKDIIFYVIVAVLAVALGVSAVLEAVNGTTPMWLGIIIAVACVGILVLAGGGLVGTVKISEAKATEATPSDCFVVYREEETCDTCTLKQDPVAPVENKKKTTTKKTTKK